MAEQRFTRGCYLIAGLLAGAVFGANLPWWGVLLIATAYTLIIVGQAVHEIRTEGRARGD